MCKKVSKKKFIALIFLIMEKNLETFGISKPLTYQFWEIDKGIVFVGPFYKF